ncbi:alanine racemase [Amylibacter kogurei]|uniref:Alanine racemase n=1 Tax=Paramylibacter kogurei TaxID=1889778 RepID=A0A2G5K7I7_9RHOB|nr:alanine racemase [Amylibacter kogurei]PIB25089.1 alanine racemase [Amylibacter kogurei]
MATATLTIDLDAIAQNWRALDGKSAPNIETAAVIKADAYGLGADVVAKSLHRAGVKSFFVALAEEGIIIRKSVGNDAKIYVLSGMMLTDAQPIRDYNLIPMLNAPEQVTRFRNETSDLAYGLQLDTGMNRLGLEPDEFMGVKDAANDADLIISHLACADEPTHPQNSAQLAAFHAMTDGVNTRRSLAATGGTLLGADYHFDLCRPGVGLYGGFPFADAKPVAHLAIPVIQTRKVAKGETVGYSATWTAKRDSVVATLAAGYADGLIRAMGHNPVSLFAGDTPCPLIGRVSMDLLTVDVTDLDTVPNELHLLNSTQTIEDLANAAGTIGYEILTSLGGRYARRYIGGA